MRKTRGNRRTFRGNKFKKSAVTRKGKRNNVVAKAKSRAPLVECKKLTRGVQSGFINPAQYFTLFPQRSFLDMRQGLDEDNMIGTSAFSKYYSMKVKINFPTEHPIKENFRAQLIWGWMTAPFAYTNSAPTGEPTRNNVTVLQLEQNVVDRVQDGFNQKVDQMNFRDKEKQFIGL